MWRVLIVVAFACSSSSSSNTPTTTTTETTTDPPPTTTTTTNTDPPPQRPDMMPKNATACASDADCVLSWTSGQVTCCNGTCGQDAWHKADLAAYDAKIAALKCTQQCPPLPCAPPAKVRATCTAGRCKAV